jgi:streptogramin lyase
MQTEFLKRKVSSKKSILLTSVIILSFLIFFNSFPLTFAQEYASIKMLGFRGSGDGQFSSPSDIEVDSNDNIYVLDAGNNRIQKFSDDGSFLTKWIIDENTNPLAIAIDPVDNVYITGKANPPVTKFSNDGSLLTQWGIGLGGNKYLEEYLGNPTGIDVDSSGKVIIANLDSHQIKTFEIDGKYQDSIGSNGLGEGQFSFPTYFLRIGFLGFR